MTDIKRRNFTKLLGTGVIAVPVASLVASLPSHADDMPMVDPEAPNAAALQYMAESDKEGKTCATCTLYSGAADAEGGPCPLFQGAHVHAAGWCSAYVPKA